MEDPLLSIAKMVGVYLFIFPLKNYFKGLINRIPPNLSFKTLFRYHFPRFAILKKKIMRAFCRSKKGRVK